MANKTSGNGGKRGITVLSGLAAWTRGTYADFMEHDKVYLLAVPTLITSGENAGRIKIGDGVSKWSELPFQDAPIWEALGGKQDKLVGEGEGQNIKTVGGVDIMGTGDIPLPESPAPSDSTPAMDGTGSAGEAETYSRGDHKHPSDTAKQDTLVGTGENQNIKTIGGESILGTGDIPFPPAPEPVDISLKANKEIIPDIPVSILSGGELKGGLFDPTHTLPVPRYTLPPIDPDAPAYVGAVYKTDNPVATTRIIVGQTWSVFSQAWIRGSAVMQYATDPSPSVLANTDDIVFTLDAFANFILESAYAAVNWQPSETEGPTNACLVKDMPDVDAELSARIEAAEDAIAEETQARIDEDSRLEGDIYDAEQLALSAASRTAALDSAKANKMFAASPAKWSDNASIPQNSIIRFNTEHRPVFAGLPDADGYCVMRRANGAGAGFTFGMFPAGERAIKYKGADGTETVLFTDTKGWIVNSMVLDAALPYNWTTLGTPNFAAYDFQGDTDISIYVSVKDLPDVYAELQEAETALQQTKAALDLKANKEISGNLPLTVTAGQPFKGGFYDLNKTRAIPRYTRLPIDPNALAYVGAVYKLTEYPDSSTRVIIGQIWSVSFQAWIRGAATLANASDPDPAVLADTDAVDFGMTSLYTLTRESGSMYVNWQPSPEEPQTFAFLVKDLSEKVDKEEGKGLSHIDVTQADKDRWDSGGGGTGGELSTVVDTKASLITEASAYNWTSPSIPKNLLLVFAIKKIDFSYCPAGSYYSREFAPPSAGALSGFWYAGNDGVHKGIWVQLNDSENAPAADSFSYIYDADNDTWPLGWYWPVYGDMNSLVTVGSPVFPNYSFTSDDYIRVCTDIKDLPIAYEELLTAISKKQDKLVGEGEGQNIKTVGGVNIMGAGNIPVGGGGGSQEYTYICDTDAKLADWSNNVTTSGQNYTSVLVVGVRTLSKDMGAGTGINPNPMIDLKAIGTKRVTGAAASALNLNNTAFTNYVCGINGVVTNTYPDFDDPGKDYSITGVTLNFVGSGAYNYGFFACANLLNCTSNVTGIGSYGYAFFDCFNLHDCLGVVHSGGTNRAFSECSVLIGCTGSGLGSLPAGTAVSGTGFGDCNYLTDCKGIGEGTTGGYGFRTCDRLSGCTGSGTASAGIGYGFSSCNYLTNCNGTGTGTDAGRGFNNSTYLTNCRGKGTAAEGGNAFGFTICEPLTNCIGTADGSGNAYGFESCNNLTNCTGTGTGGGGNGRGFYNCTNLTSCTGAGTGTDGNSGYGFYNCKRMGYCKPSSTASTTSIYNSCYADGGTAVPIDGTGNDDAAHGWNSGTAVTAPSEKMDKKGQKRL